jgi:hypothetical protein
MVKGQLCKTTIEKASKEIINNIMDKWNKLLSNMIKKDITNINIL